MILRVLPVRVATKKVYCSYLLDGTTYTHTFTLPTTIKDADDPRTQRLLNWLSIVHAPYLFSIEYVQTIQTDFPLTSAEKAFFEKLIFLGMAEFRYVNKLPITLRTSIEAPSEERPANPPDQAPRLEGCFLLNGGGKDGSASATVLGENNLDFTWFQLNTSVAQEEIVKASGEPVIVCKRYMDPRRKDGKYQGHRPTSAAIAVTAVLCAWLLNKRDVIASNESSANESNTTIDGVSINHQHSKSIEFEEDFSGLLREFGIPVRYFSLLRPLHELQIVQLAAKGPYLGHFTSCNHGYTEGVWCMECPKCAFIALAFSAVSSEAPGKIWPETPQPLALPALYAYLHELVSDDQHKPLECVGTDEECKLAAAMALKQGYRLPQNIIDSFTKAANSIDFQEVHGRLVNSLAAHNIPKDYQPVLADFERTFKNA
ncbi:MAG TPA: hypothetical protein VFT16_02915 [Candidatus Saccharimonadales bacterium]|nr:hypothetical protein [Candidatus Saccharimonadales bacterium]